MLLTLLQSQVPAIPGGVLAGLLVIIAALVVILLTVLGKLESRVSGLVDTRLNDPRSPLGEHRVDPNAHEAMREKMASRLEEKFDDLRSTLDRNRVEASQALRHLEDAIVKPLSENHGRLLNIVEQQMSRRRMGDPDFDDTANRRS